MKKELELVKFNLTPIMSKEFIQFNKLKKELIYLKKKKDLNNEILIKNIEKDLNDIRKRFIKEFRKNNKEEINKYLEIREKYNLSDN